MSSSIMCPQSWINSPLNTKNLPFKVGCQLVRPSCHFLQRVYKQALFSDTTTNKSSLLCAITEIAGVSVGDAVVEVVKE